MTNSTTNDSVTAILCPPCDIDLHGQCWWFDGDETADGPCQCSCHADHVQFVADERSIEGNCPTCGRPLDDGS